MKEQQTLIDLSKSLIEALTNELNSELKKISIISTEIEKNEIMTNCDGLIAKLNSRIIQLKTIISK